MVRMRIILCFIIMLFPAYAACSLVDPSNESEPNPKQKIGLAEPHTSTDTQHRQVGLVKPHTSKDSQQEADLLKPHSSADAQEKPTSLLKPHSSGDVQQKEVGLMKPQSPTDAQSEMKADYQFMHVEQVDFEIRYMASDAEEVFLLWALDSWQVPDKSLWPPGATAKLQFPYCRMRKDGEAFTLTLNLPKGAMLDYCFNVLDPSKGIDIWDTNGAAHRDYHSKIVQDGAAVIMAQDYSSHKTKTSTAKPSSRLERSILVIAVALVVVIAGIMLLRRIHSKAA